MSQNWTVIDSESGAVLAQVETSGSHPRFHGFDWDGETMTAKMTERAGDPAVESFDGTAWVLDPAKLDRVLHARIDREAGEVRCRFLTSIPAQDLTYQRKESEARAWLAADAPDPADFPFLVREAAATAQTVTALAAEVVASADQWADLGSRIEAARVGGKRAVTLAATQAAKLAAAAIAWDEVVA
jgi:hypothetical protein